MQIQVTYTLPDEKDEYECARQGHNYLQVLTDWTTELRNHRKYGHDAPTEETWFALLREHGVDLTTI